MKKLLINYLLGGVPHGERLPPPTTRTVMPDEMYSQYLWFKITHASARWAKDFHYRENVIAYLGRKNYCREID